MDILERKAHELILTDQLTVEIYPRYVALSYCWGSIPNQIPPKSLESNLGDRLTGISLSELPAAFGEVIDITRGLGLRWLWIDSLCTVQDDDEHWSIESGKMKHICSNSFLTVALSAVDSTHQSFVVCPTAPAIKVPYVVKNRRPLVEIIGSVIQRVSMRAHLFRIPIGIFEAGCLMPRRILHFAEHSTYFECQTHLRQENCIEHLPR